MDSASLKPLMRNLAIVLLGVCFAACNTAPSQPTSVATSEPAPQIAPPSVEIHRPVNVSFSTYSKDWPVDWQWIDPDERHARTPHDVKSGVLRISIPSKKAMQGENLSAPRFVKAIKGDFQIETRVRFAPKENYQGAGLLVYVDDQNYLRFERSYGGTGGGGEGIRLEAREGIKHKPIVTPRDVQTEVSDVDLKIVRTGNLFIAFWRENEEHEWREAGEYQSQYPESIMAGVAALNTARPVTAEFAYIRLLPGVGR